MPCLWDPLTLSFSDSNLEAHYSKYRSINAFVGVDVVFAYFGIASAVSLVMGWWRGKLAGRYFLISFGNVLCAVAMVHLLKRESRSWFLRHRTWIVSIQRTVRVGMGVYVLILSYELSPLTVITLFVCLCFYWTCGMPLSLKAHVLHHVLAMGLAFLHFQWAYCGQHYELWHATFTALKLSRTSENDPVEECRRSILIILFTFGFALPTYFIWVMELKSRIYFMMQMRIPLVGTISRFYMAVVLLTAIFFIWLLVLFII